MKWAPGGVVAGMLLAAVLAGAGAGAAQNPPFQILTTHLPLPRAGEPYHVVLHAQGGTPPYLWSAQHPDLPEGLELDGATGVISGVPDNSRAFSVLIRIQDSGSPPLTETRLLPTAKGPPLDLAWTAPPEYSGGELHGALKLRNDSEDTVTATVIVEAVNEIGKAFALRYDHRDLAPGKATPELAFEQTLPPGTYSLGADAVGEIPAKGAIYRTRLEAPKFTVPGG